jgi:hypothetical protein
MPYSSLSLTPIWLGVRPSLPIFIVMELTSSAL